MEKIMTTFLLIIINYPFLYFLSVVYVVWYYSHTNILMVNVTPCGEQKLKFWLSYFAFQLLFPVKLLGVSAPQMYPGLAEDLQVIYIYETWELPNIHPQVNKIKALCLNSSHAAPCHKELLTVHTYLQVQSHSFKGLSSFYMAWISSSSIKYFCPRLMTVI